MGDSNGRLDSPMSNHAADSVSPPSLKDGKSERSDIFRSNTSSPLLETEPMPLEDQSHCPYCHKDFRKPRVLDCLHSMCEDCIIAQLDGRREAQKAQELATRDPTDCELETPKLRERPTPPGVIRCPICAQESHVGNDVRYVHTMLLDYVRLCDTEEVRGERRCRACKSEQAAVAFCKQCQSDLCANCLNAHGVMRMFDGHEAVTYAELERLGEQSDVRPVLCPTHHMPFKMLCATCETLSCKHCIEMEHINHKVIEVTELVVSAIQREVKTLVDKVDAKWRDSMAEWSSIPDRSATLHEQYETAKVRLEASFEELIKALEEAKARKLSELDDARQRQEQGIEDLYRKMNLNEARVNDALCFTRRLLDKTNGMELLASRRKVVQQLNNLSHTMPALGTQVELEFQPLSKKQVDSQIGSICGVVVGRMVTSVKDQPAAVGSDYGRGGSTSHSIPNENGGLNLNTPIGATVAGMDAWQTGPGMQSAGVLLRQNGQAERPMPNLGAIGTERKKTSVRSSSDAFGWPPSSNPPDLPSPSPPIGGLPNNGSKDLPQPIGVPSLGPPGAPIGPPGAPLGMSSGLAANAAASIYNNYQWPPSSNPPHTHNGSTVNGASVTSAGAAGVPGAGGQQAALAYQMQLAQTRQMAMMLQNNAVIGSNPNNLLMQARLRGLAPGSIDPLLSLGNLPGLSNLSNLSIGGPLADGPGGGGQRTSPPDNGLNNRVSDLKIHSVFGTSNQGSSIRELHCPSGFCLSDSDDILIADTNNHRVVVCGPPHPWKIGRPGTDDGMLCFPRKVIALKGESTRYVVLDKGSDGKTRAQIFDGRGEFQKRVNMMHLLPRGGIEVSAATCSAAGHLMLVDTNGVVYCIDVDIPRVVYWFDASSRVGEASDVAVYEKNVYITDFKHHCVQVFNIDGQFIRKLGEPSQTPYPIGIDVSKNGDVLVADTHGNHLHVVVYNPDGQMMQSFTHNEFRLSRCVGLRVAGSGHIVTLCKHNHTLFVFKPLYIR